MKKTTKGDASVILLVMLFALLALASVVVVASYLFDESTPENYAAWCKLTGRKDLTFEEWERLYDANLLGNPRSDTVVVPMPIYTGGR